MEDSLETPTPNKCQHPAESLIDDEIGYMYIAAGQLCDSRQMVQVCTVCGDILIPEDAFADAEGSFLF